MSCFCVSPSSRKAEGVLDANRISSTAGEMEAPGERKRGRVPHRRNGSRWGRCEVPRAEHERVDGGGWNRDESVHDPSRPPDKERDDRTIIECGSLLFTHSPLFSIVARENRNDALKRDKGSDVFSPAQARVVSRSSQAAKRTAEVSSRMPCTA